MRWICFAAALAIATPALAQPQCGERDEVVEQLERRFQEQQRGVGLVNPNLAFEVWASADGTWTILRTTPDGRACVIAGGTGWTDAAPLVGEDV